MKNTFVNLKIIFVCLCLSLLIFSCQKEEVKTELSNLELIEKHFETYNSIRESNPNILMRIYMDKENKIVAQYETPKGNGLAKIASGEMLCKADDYNNDFGACVKKYAELGVCVVIQQCAYCAYECNP